MSTEKRFELNKATISGSVRIGSNYWWYQVW